MNKLSYNEILEVLKRELNNEVWRFGERCFLYSQLGLGEIKEVANYGGEGKGETYYRVYHFIEHDVYIRVDGFYSSYNGVDFGDWNEACKEVKPEVRQVTFYE